MLSFSELQPNYFEIGQSRQRLLLIVAIGLKKIDGTLRSDYLVSQLI